MYDLFIGLLGLAQDLGTVTECHLYASGMVSIMIQGKGGKITELSAVPVENQE